MWGLGNFDMHGKDTSLALLPRSGWTSRKVCTMTTRLTTPMPMGYFSHSELMAEVADSKD